MAKKEYIERNAIIKKIEERLEEKERSLKKATDSINIYGTKHDIKQLNFVMTCVKVFLVDIPSADVEPVRYGHWEVGYFHDRVCSCCLHPDNDFNEYSHDYCPNCGAKMDRKGKNNA